MSDVVVDSSVVAKWVLREHDTPLAQQMFADVRSRGDRLIVLDLAIIEVAQAIWKQFHRRILFVDEARQLMGFLLSIPLQVEPALPRLPRGTEIAQAYGRSVYDALFIALAEEMNLPGVTADEPLQKAVGGDFPAILLLRDWGQSSP
jgi:predicted nucleic acid-binding protein